jgi:hypothetical protein
LKDRAQRSEVSKKAPAPSPRVQAERQRLAKKRVWIDEQGNKTDDPAKAMFEDVGGKWKMWNVAAPPGYIENPADGPLFIPMDAKKKAKEPNKPRYHDSGETTYYSNAVDKVVELSDVKGYIKHVGGKAVRVKGYTNSVRSARDPNVSSKYGAEYDAAIKAKYAETQRVRKAAEAETRAKRIAAFEARAADGGRRERNIAAMPRTQADSDALDKMGAYATIRANRLESDKARMKVKGNPSPAPFPTRDADTSQILAQIGGLNVGAISGGRVKRYNDGVNLPVGNGYSVDIRLAPDDTYTVRRLFTRKGKITEHGTMTGIYAEQLGNIAYYASCYRNGETYEDWQPDLKKKK